MKAITVEPKQPGSARYGEFPEPDVHQGSNTINLLRIDPKSGRLTPTGRSLTVVSPVCVRFVPIE